MRFLPSCLSVVLCCWLLGAGAITYAQDPYFPFSGTLTSEGQTATFEGTALAHVLVDNDDHLLELQLTAEAGEANVMLRLLTRQRVLTPGTYDAGASLGAIETIEDGFTDLPADRFVTLAAFQTDATTTRLQVASGTLTISEVTPVSARDDLPGGLTPEAVEAAAFTHVIDGSVTYDLTTPEGTPYTIDGSFTALETLQEAGTGEAPVDAHGDHSH
ncbi:MAG: hypothetical protein GVY12_11385 [Bacteroidetes bacterium]|jgi:hypothetical protein|nr:hypothetical protein [Bacteroidota bacterium]